MGIRIWCDDVRPAPDGYTLCRSVNEAKNIITDTQAKFAHAFRTGATPDYSLRIDLIDLDHDAGDFASDGGDYIELLNWLEWLFDGKGTYIKFRFHSMNPVGVANMRRIVQKNGWTEVK